MTNDKEREAVLLLFCQKGLGGGFDPGEVSTSEVYF